ncbi:unnamed protein product [Effrenium voratum]|nr:unnamed protein product [Effrenium voratum]
MWDDSSMMWDSVEPLSRFESLELPRSPNRSRSWAAQQAYCRSLMSSRNESRLNSPTCQSRASRADCNDSEELDSDLRLEHLRRSFSVFAEEVEAKLSDLRRRPVWDYQIDVLHDMHVEESGSDRPPSSNTTLSFVASEIRMAPPRRRKSEDWEDSEAGELPQGPARSIPANAEEMQSMFYGAGITVMPLKQAEPLVSLEGTQCLDMGNAYSVLSAREEMLRAVKQLNLYRWFCKLPPVHLEEEEVQLCECLSEALALRRPMFAAESHALTRRISDLGEQLGGFMAKGDRTVLLHKESSLISAIAVGVLCNHTGGWSYASAPAPGANDSSVGLRAQEEILRRAAQHRDWLEALHVQPRPKTAFVPKPTLAKEKEPVTLNNLPSNLAGYRAIWEINERWKEPQQETRMLQDSRLDSRQDSRQDSRPGTTSRSRPGTVASAVSGRSTPQESRRPRTRAVNWSSTENARRKEWSRASNLSWGDRTKTVLLRRQLLSPKLRSLGGARMGDTCILTSTPNDGKGDMDAEEPDFVIFPCEGVCPMELLAGCHLPTWTIMPNCNRFQPTHALQVRMWRVRLLRDGKQNSSPHMSRMGLSLDVPYEAIRLEELPLSFLTCDCSSEGNSFCVIFRPQLLRLCDGDQLEVELRGLLGTDERQHFFHEFRACGDLKWKDHQFMEEIQGFCQKFSDVSNFAGDAECRVKPSPSLKGAELPELGLVTHPAKEFKTDEAELTIYLQCFGVEALEARLQLQRSDGRVKVDRATSVLNMKDLFLVRVKLPCSVSKYQLSFFVATTERPRKLVEHPFKYIIKSTESSPCPVSSIEHPAFQNFGFCPLAAAAQPLNVTLLAPLEYGLLPGSVYFLVYLPGQGLDPDPEPVGEVPRSQLFQLLQADSEEAEQAALESDLIKTRDPLFQEELDRSQRLQQMTQRRHFQTTQKMMLHRSSRLEMDPIVNLVRRLHHGVEVHLKDRTQDLPGNVHLDLVISEARSHRQRFAYRLQRCLGFPDFFEGVLHLNDHDAGCCVELFYRVCQEQRKAPLKIGEWSVARPNDMSHPELPEPRTSYTGI